MTWLSIYLKLKDQNSYKIKWLSGMIMKSKEFNINSVVFHRIFMICRISWNQFPKKFILLIKDRNRARIHSESISIQHQLRKDH